MENITKILYRLVWATTGQDLIEYALMVGFVVVSAGALIPGISESIRTIFEKVISCSKMDVAMIRILCAALAAVFLGVIVLRRRNDEEDY